MLLLIPAKGISQTQIDGSPCELKTEYLENPIGLDNPAPRLSSRDRLVTYTGKKLRPFTKYYWKVICGDMEHQEFPTT